MPQITKIHYASHKDRYWVYIDGEYCCSIRSRTFPAMGLTEGQEITCDEVKQLESFHFKNSYQDSWEAEKVRLEKVSGLLKAIQPNLVVNVTGFGADSTEFISEHPEEQGKPDLEVIFNGQVVMLVEVTGTESRRGDDYWVRPDKLQYCQKHPDQNVWIILHYAKPEEKFVFIKPNPTKQYRYEVKTIRGTDEHYVVFDDSSHEVFDISQFRDELLSSL